MTRGLVIFYCVGGAVVWVLIIAALAGAMA